MAKRKMASPACSACRVQRKKCSETCLLAPHFPSDDPHKFTVVQRVFGTGYIAKMLQGVEGVQRADAVNSLVYEASARVKHPIHGSATAIHQLQKRIAELEAQLAATEKELINIRSQNDNLVFLLGTHGSQEAQHVLSPIDYIIDEEVDPLLLWGPLWEV